MERDERLYPISEEIFNRTVLPIYRRELHLERTVAQSIPLPGVARDSVYSEDRASLAGFA
jgi:hypothetical protein